MKYLIIISILLSLEPRILAQYGLLDLNFNANGYLTLHINDSSSEANDIAVQSDNKILIAGYAYNGHDMDFALVRLFPDGSIDHSFGTDGKVLTDFSSEYDVATSMKIQNDGKIVLGGMAANGSTFAVARYNIDGTPDSTFSMDGKDTCGVGAIDYVGPSLLLQDDGKILLVGSDSVNDTGYCSIVRYTSSGVIDTSFHFDEHAVQARIHCGALQQDGKILAGGFVFNNEGWDFIMARFNTDGTIDNSFSYDGLVTTDLMFGDDIHNIALEDDQKILAAGYSMSNLSIYYASLLRYMPDGTLDDQFADHGEFTYANPDNGLEDIDAIHVQPDHKIITAGYGYGGNSYFGFEFFRFNADGSADSTFGTDGRTEPHIDYVCYAHSLAMQQDGLILACGYAEVANNDHDMMVMRLTSGYQPPSAITAAKVKSSVTIYPNPFFRELVVENPDYREKNTRLKIFSVDGRLLFSTELVERKSTVDPGNLPSGTYIVRIENSDKVFSEAIVKR